MSDADLQGHLVTSRPPRHQGRGLARAGTAVYLALARAAAQYLGRCPVVESVYVRRSLAAGEVAFGRSDIDLGVRLRDACAHPGEGRALLPLKRAARRLAAGLPLVGELEVFSPGELEDWVRIEPLRESFDRSAILLYGPPFRIPPWTIRRDDAAARFCFWFDRYLPTALARRQRRNLEKFALEMWAALAILQGHFEEPPLSRQEMAAAWRRLDPHGGPPAAGAPVDALAAVIFELARAAHALLRPPLAPLRRPVSFDVALPPMLGMRRVEVGPVAWLVRTVHAGAPPPIRLTPEALDLYVHYANPFLFERLPAELRDAGLQPPGLERSAAAIERWTHGHVARRPAFGSRTFGQGPRAIAFARLAAERLSSGDTTGRIALDELGGLARQDATRDEYFEGGYAAAYRACAEARALVGAIRRRAPAAPAAAGGVTLRAARDLS